MKLDFRQTGGFAGLAKTLHIETDKLPSDEASKVIGLVKASGFFSIESPDLVPQPDRETYTITLTTEDGNRTLHLGSNAVPPSLKPLLQYLTHNAQYEKHQR